MVAEQQLIEELGNLDQEQIDIASTLAQVTTSDPDVATLKSNLAAVQVCQFFKEQISIYFIFVTN